MMAPSYSILRGDEMKFLVLVVFCFIPQASYAMTEDEAFYALLSLPCMALFALLASAFLGGSR